MVSLINSVQIFRSCCSHMASALVSLPRPENAQPTIITDLNEQRKVYNRSKCLRLTTRLRPLRQDKDDDDAKTRLQ